MADTDENIVEPDVTGFGNPSLDSDKIDDATDAAIDNLLDEALGETKENNEQPNIADTGENTDNSLENSVVPTETQGEKTTGESQVNVQPEPQQPVEPKIDIDPEIAAIEQPRNLSEKNQSNWRKLQETASVYKQQAAEAEILRQRLAEAEQRKEIPQDYDELKKFRQIFDIKNDPEFRSKYEAPIQSAKENVYAILRKHGAGDEVISSIEQAGGPDKIADSFWKQSAFQNLPLTDAEKLKRNLVDVADLKEKQEAEIANAAENAEQILAQRENANKEWYGKTVEQIDKFTDEFTKNIPEARYVEVPPNATQEQITQIQRHNDAVTQYAQKYQSYLWPTTAEHRAEVAIKATMADELSNRYQAAEAQKNALLSQIAKLTEENNKLKGSSKLPKQTVNTQSAPKNANLSDRIKMPAADAIDMGLDEAGA